MIAHNIDIALPDKCLKVVIRCLELEILNEKVDVLNLFEK